MAERVFVYFNIRRKLWSVRDCKTRLVIKHTNRICLKNVEFKVSEAGRQRVLKERRKNVHAGIEGIECCIKDIGPLRGQSVVYNPFITDSFVISGSQPVKFADAVFMDTRAVFKVIAINPTI